LNTGVVLYNAPWVPGMHILKDRVSLMWTMLH